MTAFLALVRKDLILFLSDRRALMLNLLMPIVLAAFFGSLFGGSASESKNSRIEVALVRLDNSEVGQKIGAGLKADPALQVEELSLAAAQDKVRAGKLKAAIVIPDGFGKAAGAALFGAGARPDIPIFYDPSQAAVLAMVKGMLSQQVMQIVSADMFSGNGARALLERSVQASAQDSELGTFLASLKYFQDRERGHSGTAAPAAGGLSVPFATRDQALSSGPKYNGYAHSFAGMSVQFILFMGIDMGIGILLARRTGIWNRLLAAPVTLSSVLLARAVSAALIAFGLLCVIFACAMLIFKVRIGNPVGFVGMGLCFALMTASFGLLIAAFGKTPEAARGLAVFATLVMVMLGGAWVPSFIFPQWLQRFTVIMPTRWAVDGFDAVTWRGVGMDAAVTPMLVLLAFALLFGSVAIWKFRREQK